MRDNERQFANEALRKAKKDPRKHKVGAAIAISGKLIGSDHGGRLGKDDHAESALIERKFDKTNLEGATIYATLEPCMRGHWVAARKKSCAEIIVNRKIRRVVMGMRDPDPRIYGEGETHLKRNNVVVSLFPDDLRRECENINAEWIKTRQKKWTYKNLWRVLPLHRSGRAIEYPDRLAVGEVLTLVRHPDPCKGWKLSKIRLVYDNRQFLIPIKYRMLYKLYFRAFFDTKRFFDDRAKLMLTANPWVSSDTPTLVLHTRKTKYSHVQFYKDVVGATPVDGLIRGIRRLNREREDVGAQLINELLVGKSRVPEFPHAFCIHLIVLTQDEQILMLQRVPESEYRGYSWGVSIEEHMSIADVEDHKNNAIVNWVRRALDEELRLDSTTYNLSDIRLLSIFLETDILNISACAIVKLRLRREELEEHLCTPRTDDEFVRSAFVERKVRSVIHELLWSRREHHPTSGYRLVMALMNRLGLPPSRIREKNRRT